MDYYYRYCEKCEGKVVMHAFSDGECTICKQEVQTSHTPCDVVCRDCSVDKNVCMSCGEILTKDFTPEQLMERYYNRSLTSEADNFVEQLEGYLNSVREEKQRLEGLILHFRSNLKNRRDFHFKETTGHATVLTAVLHDFDKHFNIEVKRNGEI